MPDFSDTRPDRWWALEAFAHNAFSCGMCGAKLPRDHAVPMLGDVPLCGNCAPRYLLDTPQTVEYASWLQSGDPRWWSAWLCNCPYCDAQGAIT